jgi:hypothetical protein
MSISSMDGWQINKIGLGQLAYWLLFNSHNSSHMSNSSVLPIFHLMFKIFSTIQSNHSFGQTKEKEHFHQGKNVNVFAMYLCHYIMYNS